MHGQVSACPKTQHSGFFKETNMTEITTWKECDLEVSKVFYYSCYCADIWHKKGMNAEVLTYEDWCKESEKIGKPLGT